MNKEKEVKVNADRIETPDLTIAKYVYTDFADNRIYYDGLSYWYVDHITGKIDYYA